MGRKSAEKLHLLRGEEEEPSTDQPSRSHSRFDQKNEMSNNDPHEQQTTTTSNASLSARSLATMNLPPDQQQGGDVPPHDEDSGDEEEDDAQHEEVVDMNQLREIANRLDIPISDLINRIRPQDSQPYDDEEEEAYDDYSDEEGGDDEAAIGGQHAAAHHHHHQHHTSSVTVDPATNIQTGASSDVRSSNSSAVGFYTDNTTTMTATAQTQQQQPQQQQHSYGAVDGDGSSDTRKAAVAAISTQSPTSLDDPQHQGMGGSFSALGKLFGRGNKETTNQYSHQAVPKRSALAKSSSFNTTETFRPSRMRFWESSKNFNSSGALQEAAPKRRYRQGQSVVVSMTGGSGSPVSSMGRGEFPTSVSGGGSPQDSRKASGLDQSQRASEGRLSASNTNESPQKAVRFGPPDQLQEVKVFEVDNSLYISIEYSRPVIGWVLLAIGLILRCVSDCIKVFKIGKDFESAYGFSTGAALGDAILCLFLIIPLWYFFLRPSKHEKRFLMSWTGMMLLASIGVIGGMTKIAPQSIADITNQWRSTALYAIHPTVIVFYGKVFKNSVFIEELLGAIILLGGFCCAMMPIDVLVDKWIFSEVLSFADSIYVASFLFLCVKARSNHVSVPITLASISMCSVVLQIIVCAVAGVPFDNSSTDSAFEFARSGATVSIWVASSIGDIISLSCFLVALRFIPPLTVSTTMVLEPLVTHFVSHLLFFNKVTAIWDLCDEDLTPTVAPQPFFSTIPPSPEDAYDGNLGKQIYCSQETAFSYTFTIGSLICVLAGGYLIYVSSIKRSKVELILKKLRKRKRPKNPYKARGGSRGGSNRSMSSASSTSSNGGGNNTVLPNPYTDPQEANHTPNPMHQPIMIPIYEDELPNVSFSSSSGSNSSSDQSLESSHNNYVGDYEAPQLDREGSPCSSPDGGSPTRVSRKKDKKEKKDKEKDSSSRLTKDPTSPLKKEKKGKMDKQEKRSKSSASPKESSSWTGIVGTKRRSAMEAEQENPTVYSSSPKAENHDD